MLTYYLKNAGTHFLCRINRINARLPAWPLSVATGREFGLGITGPSANIMQFLVTGDGKFINWGVFLVLGIFIGSFIGAKASNEFRVRVPDAATILRSGLGGILMGIGATLAGGCSIGNGLVETAFSLGKVGYHCP